MTVAKDKNLVTLETTWDLKSQAKSDVRKLGGQQYLPGLVINGDQSSNGSSYKSDWLVSIEIVRTCLEDSICILVVYYGRCMYT